MKKIVLKSVIYDLWYYVKIVVIAVLGICVLAVIFSLIKGWESVSSLGFNRSRCGLDSFFPWLSGIIWRFWGRIGGGLGGPEVS